MKSQPDMCRTGGLSRSRLKNHVELQGVELSLRSSLVELSSLGQVKTSNLSRKLCGPLNRCKSFLPDFRAKSKRERARGKEGGMEREKGYSFTPLMINLNIQNSLNVENS